MLLFSRRLLTLVIVYCTSLRCPASSALTTHRWRALGHRTVTSYEAAVVSRSRLDCVVRRCGQFSHCQRVAFDPASSTCYLLPSAQSGEKDGDGGVNLMVYRDTDGICSYDDAPVTHASVTWQHKLTSLVGNVTCDRDFVWSTNDSSVGCAANNSWTVGGECRRYYWTAPAVFQYYSTPWPVVIGWKMCATGTPFANATTLSANLFDANGNRAMKVRFFFAGHGTRSYSIESLSQVDGIFMNVHRVTPSTFPMTPSAPFFLELRAASEFKLDVTVNGTRYLTHTSPISLTTVVKVMFYNHVSLHYLDLWCT